MRKQFLLFPVMAASLMLSMGLAANTVSALETSNIYNDGVLNINKNSVTESNSQFGYSYDSDTKTLTLTGADLDSINIKDLTELNIVAKGANSIGCREDEYGEERVMDCGICMSSFGTLNINVDGESSYLISDGNNAGIQIGQPLLRVQGSISGSSTKKSTLNATGGGMLSAASDNGIGIVLYGSGELNCDIVKFISEARYGALLADHLTISNKAYMANFVSYNMQDMVDGDGYVYAKALHSENGVCAVDHNVYAKGYEEPVDAPKDGEFDLVAPGEVHDFLKHGYIQFSTRFPLSYTVTYHMCGHGTQVPSETLKEGEFITKPADPTADGYTFKGWYEQERFIPDLEADFNHRIVYDMNFYACWEESGSLTPSVQPTPSTPTSEPEQITVPQTPSKVKAKAKKNKVTVSWKKIKKNKKGKALLKQISGIQVQYSTDLGFSEGNTVTKSLSKKKSSVKLKLQKKTIYYIRMRYVGSGGYSNWSGVKVVKTK